MNSVRSKDLMITLQQGFTLCKALLKAEPEARESEKFLPSESGALLRSRVANLYFELSRIEGNS